jgi:hypothetical protein
MSGETLWLSCGVVQDELTALHRSGALPGTLRFLNSMLHLEPLNMDAVLLHACQTVDPAFSRVVLVYGDCCPDMLQLTHRFQLGRVAAINCAQLLLGRSRYRELMQEEVFLLLPEWAVRWREVMQKGLGLTPEVARDLMQEVRQGGLVYLDTGLIPVPEAELEACAQFSGLPWRLEKVSLAPLLDTLLDAEANAPVRGTS